jgi:hypothetical protein
MYQKSAVHRTFVFPSLHFVECESYYGSHLLRCKCEKSFFKTKPFLLVEPKTSVEFWVSKLKRKNLLGIALLPNVVVAIANFPCFSSYNEGGGGSLYANSVSRIWDATQESFNNNL